MKNKTIFISFENFKHKFYRFRNNLSIIWLLNMNVEVSHFA